MAMIYLTIGGEVSGNKFDSLDLKRILVNTLKVGTEQLVKKKMVKIIKTIEPGNPIIKAF